MWTYGGDCECIVLGFVRDFKSLSLWGAGFMIE